jgi:hypothetical protein
VTYHRASFLEGGPNWSTHAIYSALAEPMKRFADQVDKALVCDDFHERLGAALPDAQSAPRKPHRPGGFWTGRPPSSATQGMPPKK